MNKNSKNKITVIGLDGGSFLIIDYLMDRGRLPNFKKFLSAGNRGTLMSTIPPITPAAWASFFTGRDPGGHGVYDFFQRDAGSYLLKPVCGADVKGLPIWIQASKSGKRVCVHNVPMTYPVMPVNGIMISGMDAPQFDGPAIYPREFKQIIDNNFPNYQIEFSINPLFLEKHSTDPVREFQEKMLTHLESELAVINFLKDLEDWDLFISVIRSTDALQHVFWKSAETVISYGEDKVDQAVLNRAKGIFDCYERIDLEIGERWLNSNSQNLIFMSDHGFGVLEKEVCANRILAEAGLLRFKKRTIRRGIRKNISRQAYLWLPAKARAFMGNFARERLGVGSLLSDSLIADIDWERTQVYSLGQYGCLFTNVRGREPFGVISGESQRKAVLANAQQALTSYVNPDDDKPIITEFDFREDIFRGPLIFRMPDAVYVMRNYAYRSIYSTSSELDQNEIICTPCPEYSHLGNSGVHRREGLIAMAGPDIRPGDMGTVSIMDLAPTIMTLLNLPLQQEFNGQILAAAINFQPGYGLSPISSQDMSNMGGNGISGYGTEEEQIIRSRLEDLGYL